MRLLTKLISLQYSHRAAHPSSPSTLISDGSHSKEYKNPFRAIREIRSLSLFHSAVSDRTERRTRVPKHLSAFASHVDGSAQLRPPVLKRIRRLEGEAAPSRRLHNRLMTHSGDRVTRSHGAKISADAWARDAYCMTHAFLVQATDGTDFADESCYSFSHSKENKNPFCAIRKIRSLSSFPSAVSDRKERNTRVPKHLSAFASHVGGSAQLRPPVLERIRRLEGEAAPNYRPPCGPFWTTLQNWSFWKVASRHFSPPLGVNDK